MRVIIAPKQHGGLHADDSGCIADLREKWLCFTNMNDLAAEIQPHGILEILEVERIAICCLRQKRALAYEQALSFSASLKGSKLPA